MNNLNQKDLEQIESLIYKNIDDLGVSIARSFERFEERIDAMEQRYQESLSNLHKEITHINTLLDLETGILQDCRKR